MSLEITAWDAAAPERVRTMAAHDSLQPEFEALLGAGFETVMGDAYNRAELRRVAAADGRDAGFALSFVVPTEGRPFVAVRLAVLEGVRRRGVGSALLAASLAAVRERFSDCAEALMSAYRPGTAAAGFAAYHGFAPSRTYWLMERPGDTVPEPEWPAGVTLARFEPVDRDFTRWVEVFNRAWREHDHAVLATVEDLRRHLAGGTLKPAHMFFAERDGAPVGFLRNAIHATRGEIAVVGVVPEARGIGLGRALLRFGCRKLIEHRALPVTLSVDGLNKRALRLYAQEGFEVLRTRQVWSKRL